MLSYQENEEHNHHGRLRAERMHFESLNSQVKVFLNHMSARLNFIYPYIEV